MGTTSATSLPTRIKPPTIAWVSLLLGYGVHTMLGSGRVLPSVFLWVGPLVTLAGIIVMGWAVAECDRLGTTHKVFGEASALVSSGLFAHSRNPMYLGMTAALAGIGLFVGSIPMLVPALAFWGAMHFVFVPYEEAKLEAGLGTAYVNYKKRVRRWV